MSISELSKVANPVDASPGTLRGDEVADVSSEQSAAAKSRYRWQMAFFVAVCCVVLLMLMGPGLLPPKVDNLHYVYLAQSLVHGQLTIDKVPANYSDIVLWQGHKYLPLGPLPAVILIPFLPLLQLGLSLVWVGYLFTLLNIWLTYRVLGLTGITDERRPWAMLLFFGGTVYLSVALVGSSYFLAHILTVTFILLAIQEVVTRRRPWLVGLILGLAGMVRLTSVFCIPFFLWLLWRGSKNDTLATGDTPERESGPMGLSRYRKPAVDGAFVLAGLAVPMLILLAYNYARFQSPFESGYNLVVLTLPAFAEARAAGLFSLVHIPKNLFMMFLQGPTAYPSDDAPVLLFPYIMPTPWGMGLVYTSPAIFYAFRSKFKEPFVKACWLGIVVAIVPIITYYGIGWIQFGFRYALDFLPLALLLAARGFPSPMSRLSKLLVLTSVAVSTWGALILLMWIHVAG